MHGNIDLNNYEAWILDFHEGNLNELRISQLMAFMELHPELKAELENFESVTLNEEKVSFKDKSGLKKDVGSIGASSFDETAVKYIEGELSIVETKQLMELVSTNVSLQKDLAVYQKTKLMADAEIICDFKNELKRGKKRPVIWYWSAAATVAILLVSYFLLRTGTYQQGLSHFASVNCKSHRKVKDSIPRIMNERSIAYKQQNINIVSPKEKQIKNIFPDENHPIIEDEPIVDTNEVKDPLAVTASNNASAGSVDSINIFYKNSYYEEAEKAEVVPTRVVDTLSLRENIAARLKTGLLKDEMKDESSYKEKKTKITWYDVALLATKGVRKVTKKKVEIKKKYDGDDNLVAYEFTAGDRSITKAVKR